MLNVAVVCRQKAYEDTRQKLGWWSYPVEGLSWTFYPTLPGQELRREAFAEKHDLIVWEDWIVPPPVWLGKRRIPIFYVIVDANTSARRRENYRGYAREADVLLLDQDPPGRWTDVCARAYHWPYAVNEQRFRPQVKDVDVAAHFENTPERRVLRGQLARWAEVTGYILRLEHGLSTLDYIAALNRAKLVVHHPTHPQCRSHRLFDALASGACLLSSPVMDYGDGFQAGTHYLQWRDWPELTAMMQVELETDHWRVVADAGREFVLAHHTWAHRATEFLEIARKEGLSC